MLGHFRRHSYHHFHRVWAALYGVLLFPESKKVPLHVTLKLETKRGKKERKKEKVINTQDDAIAEFKCQYTEYVHTLMHQIDGKSGRPVVDMPRKQKARYDITLTWTNNHFPATTTRTSSPLIRPWSCVSGGWWTDLWGRVVCLFVFLRWIPTPPSHH